MGGYPPWARARAGGDRGVRARKSHCSCCVALWTNPLPAVGKGVLAGWLTGCPTARPRFAGARSLPPLPAADAARAGGVFCRTSLCAARAPDRGLRRGCLTPASGRHRPGQGDDSHRNTPSICASCRLRRCLARLRVPPSPAPPFLLPTSGGALNGRPPPPPFDTEVHVLAAQPLLTATPRVPALPGLINCHVLGPWPRGAQRLYAPTSQV